MPASQDILALEAGLATALQARHEIRDPHHPSDRDWAHAPQGWRRQYVGIVRGSRRFIYGTFLPKQSGEEIPFGESQWRTEPIPVCDGGPVFFGVEYDVETGRFTQMGFNVDPG